MEMKARQLNNRRSKTKTCATRRWRQREGSSRQPGGAEVRRRCSLAAGAAFIISRKSQFHFHFPTSRLRGATSGSACERGDRAKGRALFTGATLGLWGSRSGGPGAGLGAGHQVAIGKEGDDLTLYSYLKGGDRPERAPEAWGPFPTCGLSVQNRCAQAAYTNSSWKVARCKGMHVHFVCSWRSKKDADLLELNCGWLSRAIQTGLEFAM
ncbi:uncharacterized protein LOC110300817 [Mus caroli]|uniref:Uncharacterized protein LOC110300817 n=1 Tax=Mus caroli TaxID=10089 RepID=A0A6P5QBP3_MUSCR|nr:uncharacterized protein LOC110300817 [Mus caroli]